MSVRDPRSSRLHAGQRRGGRGFFGGVGNHAFCDDLIIILTPLAGQAGSRGGGSNSSTQIADMALSRPVTAAPMFFVHVHDVEVAFTREQGSPDIARTSHCLS